MRPRILVILKDEAKTTDQKAAELGTIQGTVTPQEVAPIGELLKKADGRLLAAVGRCLVRGGSKVEALLLVEAVASNRSAPVSQFCWVVNCTPGAFVVGPSRAKPLFDLVTDQLLERLRNPSNVPDLLELLRARKLVWGDGNIWIGDRKVFAQVCSLVENREGDVPT